MLGNMLLKSSSVNQLEMPAPGSKSQSCGAEVTAQVNKAPGVGEPFGVGGAGAASGVGTGAPAHLHKSAKLHGQNVCTPLAQGAHCSSVTAWSCSFGMFATHETHVAQPFTGACTGVGENTGVDVGTGMGAGVGADVGISVATGVGACVGACVDSAVGAGVGTVVGAAVSAGVGSGVASGAGADVAHRHKPRVVQGHHPCPSLAHGEQSPSVTICLPLLLGCAAQ